MQNESNQVQTASPRDWLVSRGYGNAELNIVRDFISARGQKPNDYQLMLFLMFCKRHNIDPFSKQAHLIITNNGPEVCLGIDSLRKFAADSGEYGGQEEPVFETDEKGNLVSCLVVVYRIVKHTRVPFPGRAWMTESRGKSPIWNQRPRGMIEKCAEAKALRKGFPERCGGIYTPEEMEGAAGFNQNAANLASAADINARLKLSEPVRDVSDSADSYPSNTTAPEGLGPMLTAFTGIGITHEAILRYAKRDNFAQLTEDDMENLRAWYKHLTDANRE